MAEYKGSIELIGGITQKNNGDFPLVSARDVQVDDTGKRLDEKLAEIGSGGGDADTQTIEEMLQGFDSDPGSVKKYVDEVAGDGAGYAESAQTAAARAEAAETAAEQSAENAAQSWASAENAKTAAQSAQSAAETAKNEAQALKSEVEQKLANGDYKGDDGKSAYAYAKDGGYKGTEAEFAEAVNPDNIIAEAESFVVDELAKRGQLKPEFVNSIEELNEKGDESKLYVLPDGNIYGYIKKTVFEENNEYNPATVKFNKRLNSSNTEKGLDGAMLTDYIEAEYAENYPVTIKGIEKLVINYGSYFLVDFYTADKTHIGQLTNDHLGYSTNTNDGTLPITFNLFYHARVEEKYKNAKYVRIKLGIATDGTSISASNCEGLVINFEPKNISTTGWQWANTGHAFIPADYEDRIVELEKESVKQGERITLLESGSSSSGVAVAIPTFWEDAVSACISKIKALQMGKNCVTFPFFSDNHTRNGYNGLLIAHIMKECHIPFCFYGGDTIASGYLTETEMIAQDKAFDTAMSYVPNGRFCRAVGNHDGFWKVSATEKYSYTRDQVYELFLREEAIAQNKHYGEDGTYYYVDDIASKVRWVVLNTNPVDNHGAGSEVIDSTQLSWLQNTALSINESGWGVVIISHCPISNHYHANVTNATEVIATVNNSGADIIGWYSGHIHRDRMYTHSAVGSSDGVEGTDGAELGFTEVTITSDHTGISYEDVTKHTVANDDKSHAIDFITINKTTRSVNITRLGIGEDRSYTY